MSKFGIRDCIYGCRLVNIENGSSVIIWCGKT